MFWAQLLMLVIEIIKLIFTRKSEARTALFSELQSTQVFARKNKSLRPLQKLRDRLKASVE